MRWFEADCAASTATTQSISCAMRSNGKSEWASQQTNDSKSIVKLKLVWPKIFSQVHNWRAHGTLVRSQSLFRSRRHVPSFLFFLLRRIEASANRRVHTMMEFIWFISHAYLNIYGLWMTSAITLIWSINWSLPYYVLCSVCVRPAIIHYYPHNVNHWKCCLTDKKKLPEKKWALAFYHCRLSLLAPLIGSPFEFSPFAIEHTTVATIVPSRHAIQCKNVHTNVGSLARSPSLSLPIALSILFIWCHPIL